MSTKTTFKRIALVAVAALGLGVLSVAPSSAAVINLALTPVNGTATTAVSDSSTAATLRVTFTGQSNIDTVTITSYVSSKPKALQQRQRIQSLSTLQTPALQALTRLLQQLMHYEVMHQHQR
jgi:hypothetical protein